MLFSAGCLGHKLAAIEAGSMLLEPRFNDVVPLVVSFDDLEPEAKAYDIKRLNQPLTQQKELQALIDEINLHSDDDEFDKEAECRKFANILTRLRQMDQTLEVQTMMLLFSEFKNHLIKHDNLDNFQSFLAIMFARDNGVNTPLINQMLLQDDRSRDNPEHLNRLRSNYQQCLNHELIMDYCEVLEPQYLEKSPILGQPENFRTVYKKTKEARVALEEAIQLKRMAILLGEQDICFIPIPHAVLPSEIVIKMSFQESWQTHSSINVFLGYLLLARNPTSEQFKNARYLFEFALNGHPDYFSGNANRFFQLQSFQFEKKLKANPQELRVSNNSNKPVQSQESDSTVMPEKTKKHSTKSTLSSSKENIALKKEASKKGERKRVIDIVIPTVQPDTMQQQVDTKTTDVIKAGETLSETKPTQVEQASTVPTIDDLLPDQLQAEASPLLEITPPEEKKKVSRTLQPSKELSGERRKLHRTNSLNLGTKDAETKEDRERKTIKRSNTVNNFVVHTNQNEEPTVKKEKDKKDKKFKIQDLKKYVSSSEKKKRHQAEKQTAQSHAEEDALENRSTEAGSKSESESEGLSFKKLKKRLSNRDLKKPANASLSVTDIDDTLSTLKAHGKIDYRNEGGKIVANPKTNHNAAIVIHTTHAKNGKSYNENPKVVQEILDLSSECDDELKEMIGDVKSKK